MTEKLRGGWPPFLSDLRMLEGASEVMGEARHKWASLDLLMRSYPETKFVLVGDSGMHDPELYREVVERHPGRALAVYVHDVSPEARDDEVERIARALEERGVPLLRMENTLRAAEHACELGLISARGCGGRWSGRKGRASGGSSRALRNRELGLGHRHLRMGGRGTTGEPRHVDSR